MGNLGSIWVLEFHWRGHSVTVLGAEDAGAFRGSSIGCAGIFVVRFRFVILLGAEVDSWIDSNELNLGNFCVFIFCLQ
jgi:hypothetical protein